MAALTENVPVAARPVDARKPENDPFRQWDRLTHALGVTMPRRSAQIQELVNALPAKLKVT